MRVYEAQNSLDRVSSLLDNAVITAPVDGIIAGIFADSGSLASTGQPILVLISDGDYHVEVRIDEIDIADVTPGQDVAIIVDAYPNAPLNGEVVSISPSAASVQGIVYFTAEISFEPPEIQLLPGMTVTVAITVTEIENAVLVPNWAIRFDRDTGLSYVSIYNDAEITEIPVQIGLRGQAVSEAISGITEGQTVAVRIERDRIELGQ
jgi:RND family efflux transporter MFP subunit